MRSNSTLRTSASDAVSDCQRTVEVVTAWLRISMNPATGDGGTCYGDSGGPNFLGDTDVIAATTITGDAVCRSANTTYRLDTPSARAFLAPFPGVVLP